MQHFWKLCVGLPNKILIKSNKIHWSLRWRGSRNLNSSFSSILYWICRDSRCCQETCCKDGELRTAEAINSWGSAFLTGNTQHILPATGQQHRGKRHCSALHTTSSQQISRKKKKNTLVWRTGPYIWNNVEQPLIGERIFKTSLLTQSWITFS